MEKQKLVAAGSEKLADILVFLYENNPELTKQLDTLFAALEDNPKKLVSIIKKEISSLKRTTRFIDYYESSSFAARLDALRLNIMNSLKEKAPKEALMAMNSFIDLHDKRLNLVDDSNGEISGVFRKACKDLAELYALQKTNIDEVVKYVFDKYSKDQWGVFDEIILNFKDVLGSAGLNKLRTRFEEEKNNHRKYVIQNALQDISDAQGDVDAYITACSVYGNPSAHDRIEISERLIKHWREEEALKWLSSIDLPKNHTWWHNISILKVQALDLRGDYDLAQQERIRLFEKTMDPDLYGEILKHAKDDVKESFKKQALQKVYECLDPHLSVDFLYKIQEIEELSKFIRHSHETLSGSMYYTLRPVAKTLENIDPVASTLLYRNLIEPIMKEAKSKYYSYAAKDLISCVELAQNIKNWESFEDHDTYFKAIQDVNKRKYSFWETYNSKLKKNIEKKLKLKKAE